MNEQGANRILRNLYFAIHTGYLELLEKCKPEGHDGLQLRGRQRMEMHARLAQKITAKRALERLQMGVFCTAEARLTCADCDIVNRSYGI